MLRRCSKPLSPRPSQGLPYLQTATGPRRINADDAYRLAQADVDQQLRYGDQLVSPNAEAGTPGYGV